MSKKTAMQTALDYAKQSQDDFAEKTKKAQQEQQTITAIAAGWPANVKVTHIFVCSLYGVVGSVKIGDDYHQYHSNESDIRVSQARVAELLDLLPPLPLAIVKNGCTKIVPEDSCTDEELHHEKTTTGVWGVRVQVKPGLAWPSCQIAKWYTRLPNGLIVEVKCVFRQDAEPISVSMRVNRRIDGSICKIDYCEIGAKGKFWLDQRIKWASGSHKTPNQFTCYWLAIDDSTGAGNAWKQICGID